MSTTDSPALRASLAPMELPLLTLQLLTQLQYDRDIVKSHYASCKQQLTHQQERHAKEIARHQQTTQELQFDISNLTIRAHDVAEARLDFELQLQVITNQLEVAQARVSELEDLIEQQNHVSEARIDLEMQLEAKTNQLKTVQARVSELEEGKVGKMEVLLTRVQDLVEMMQNKCQLHEVRNLVELRVKSLEETVEPRSNVTRMFARYLKNLNLILDAIFKGYSEITAVLKHHISEIVRVEAELPRIYQNVTIFNQKYKKELLQERLKKILSGRYIEVALLDVAESGNVEDLSVILQFNVDIEARKSDGRTALHLAAENGHLKICEMLLNAGSRINPVAMEKDGDTPVHRAAWKGHLDIVRLLVRRGANLSRKNHSGRTPSEEARYWRHTEVAEYLEQHGATE